jgi:hypothetical protein
MPVAGGGRRRAHPVRAYFVVTYTVSWSYWLLIHGLLDKYSYWCAAPGAAEQGQGWFPSGSQWSKMW